MTPQDEALLAAWQSGMDLEGGPPEPQAPPEITPLTKAQLRKALEPVVAEATAAIWAEIASCRERIEWLEAKRAADIAQFGGRDG